MKKTVLTAVLVFLAVFFVMGPIGVVTDPIVNGPEINANVVFAAAKQVTSGFVTENMVAGIATNEYGRIMAEYGGVADIVLATGFVGVKDMVAGTATNEGGRRVTKTVDGSAVVLAATEKTKFTTSNLA